MQFILLRQDSGMQYRGDVIEVRSSGTAFAPTDNFVMVDVPEATLQGWEKYSESWDRMLNFDTVDHQVSLDSFRIRTSSGTNNGLTGVITLEDIEAAILDWSGKVYSSTVNAVTFDITIFDVLKSSGFWDIDPAEIIFTELSYDSQTGVHRVQADYSALSSNPTYIERYLGQDGMVIVSHANRIIVYDADRAVVSDLFKGDLTDKVKTTIERRRYFLTDTIMETIEANGGIAETSISVISSNLQDKIVA